MAIWGIDLGGTKIEGVILESADNPAVITRKRIETEADQGYDHILDRIKLLVDQMSHETSLKPKAIGIGTPGTMDPVLGAMKNSNSTALNGKPLHSDLEKILGVEVCMANDANCFALAETQMGVVQKKFPDAKVVFGVIMGTGVGGGIVVNGKVINGKQGIAGEWGHNFLDESGGQCYCGKIGCVEKVLSGKNLELHHEEKYGDFKKLKQIYQEYKEGSVPSSTDIIERLLHFFGKGVATIINILDPDVIVLGGGVGNIEELYTKGVEEVRKHVFNPRLDTIFLKPSLGDSAGVFGAAFLVA